MPSNFEKIDLSSPKTFLHDKFIAGTDTTLTVANGAILQDNPKVRITSLDGIYILILQCSRSGNVLTINQMSDWNVESAKTATYMVGCEILQSKSVYGIPGNSTGDPVSFSDVLGQPSENTRLKTELDSKLTKAARSAEFKIGVDSEGRLFIDV